MTSGFNNTELNKTSAASETRTAVAVFFFTLGVMIGIFTIFSGVLIIIAYRKLPTAQKTPTCFLIVSQAFAGVLIATMTLPFYLTNTHVIHFVPSLISLTENNKLWRELKMSILRVPYNLVMMNLVFIGIDRFIAVRYPYKYLTLVTMFRTKMFICISWILTTFLTAVVPFLPTMSYWIVDMGCKSTLKLTLNKHLQMVQTVYNTLLVLLAILTHVYVFWVAWKQKRKIASETVSQEQQSKIRSDSKFAKIMVTTLAMQIICFIPTIIVLHVASCLSPQPRPVHVDLFSYLGGALFYATSGINPILYSSRNSDIWNTIKKLFKQQHETEVEA